MSSECHETAKVTQILPGNKVQVVVQRSEACGSCAAKGACQALGGGQTEDFYLVLDNPVGARKGDAVRITLSESAVVKASAILYLLPAVALILFAIVGNSIRDILHLSSDSASVAGAVSGLGVGFLGTWVLARRAEKNQKNVPVITRVINSD